MAITRTPIVDDDGSGTTGTALDNAWKQEFYDQIDAADTALASGVFDAVIGLTAVGGPYNPLNIGGMTTNTLVIWNGAADMSIAGLGNGRAGQRVTFRNISAGKVITIHHLHASATVPNKLWNFATSAPTPIAVNGSVTYQHDGSYWHCLSHEQGPWLTPPFNAADYTAATGTWTVQAGDVADCAYRLSGRAMGVRLYLISTDTSNATAYLKRLCPGGFSVAGAGPMPYLAGVNGGTPVPAVVYPGGAGGLSFYGNAGGGGWGASVGNNSIIAHLTFEVT